MANAWVNPNLAPTSWTEGIVPPTSADPAPFSISLSLKSSDPAGSIADFASKIRGKGVQRQNKYAVFLGAVPGAGKSDNVTIMAESVSFPGQNVRSVPDTIRHGPEREQAQGMTYGDFSITFICTPGMPEKKYFENWQEAVVNKDTWEPRYYNKYIAGEMQLLALSEEEDDRYIVSIKEAFPKTISAQSFSYGSNDSYQTIEVEFSYRSWESKILDAPFHAIANLADKLSGKIPGSPLIDFSAPPLNINSFSDDAYPVPAVDTFSSLNAAAQRANEFASVSPTPAQPAPLSVNPHPPAPAAKPKASINTGTSST